MDKKLSLEIQMENPIWFILDSVYSQLAWYFPIACFHGLQKDR